MYEFIAENIANVRERIAQAAKRSGRSPDDIVLVAVTKTVDVERIKAAVACGIADIGENRVQEMIGKYPYFQGNLRWHMIGRLQRNKVKYIVDKAALIHSVDSIELIKEINKRAEILDKVMKILVEVNIGHEVTKGGLPVEEVIPFLEQCCFYRNITVKGLMTVAPETDDPEKVRPYFAQMYELSRRVEAMGLANVEMRYLSMGMSGDFEVAIEEGSNMVRIGTAIFGARPINNI